MKKALIVISKSIVTLLLTAAFLISLSSVSPIYRFEEPHPFSGPDIFNPYSDTDSTTDWKRANFHTHTRVKGIFNECEYWPDAVLDSLESFGYDIVTFSNHNRLTIHPTDPTLQVNVYEHGYNLFKYHKLVFGCSRVCRFDNLVPLFDSQKQFQIDLLNRDADIVQMNHPFRTNGTSEREMSRLTGYRLIELDSGVSTSQEYWDWALSAGHYSFALANDDLHYPDRSDRIAVRCNFLDSPSARYEDILSCLESGRYYCMRIPDYGNGDWNVKHVKNNSLPAISRIGLDGDSISISLSGTADSIIVTGQGSRTLEKQYGTSEMSFRLADNEPYARFTAWFPEGEIIYTNAFARYDSSSADSPYRESEHRISVPLSILFNLAVLALSAALFWLIVLLWRKNPAAPGR